MLTRHLSVDAVQVVRSSVHLRAYTRLGEFRSQGRTQLFDVRSRSVRRSFNSAAMRRSRRAPGRRNARSSNSHLSCQTPRRLASGAKIARASTARRSRSSGDVFPRGVAGRRVAIRTYAEPAPGGDRLRPRAASCEAFRPAGHRDRAPGTSRGVAPSYPEALQGEGGYIGRRAGRRYRPVPRSGVPHRPMTGRTSMAVASSRSSVSAPMTSAASAPMARSPMSLRAHLLDGNTRLGDRFVIAGEQS